MNSTSIGTRIAEAQERVREGELALVDLIRADPRRLERRLRSLDYGADMSRVDAMILVLEALDRIRRWRESGYSSFPSGLRRVIWAAYPVHFTDQISRSEYLRFMLHAGRCGPCGAWRFFWIPGVFAEKSVCTICTEGMEERHRVPRARMKIPTPAEVEEEVGCTPEALWALMGGDEAELIPFCEWAN